MLGALRDFMRRLGAEEEASHFGPSDTRLALAALLVHAVAIDGVTSDEERATLRDLLARKFDLSGEELELLIEDAIVAESEAVDLYRFTSVLKNRMSEDERIRVIENLLGDGLRGWDEPRVRGELDLARGRAPRR